VNFTLRPLGLLLALAWLGMPLALSAQSSDFQLWKGIVLQKSLIDGKLQFSLNEEVRLVNNASDVGNAFTDLSLHYKPIKAFSLGGGYRYSVRRLVNVHRLYADLNFSQKVGERLKINLRGRYQFDMTPFEKSGTARLRLNLNYNLPKTKIEPYLNAEPWLDVGGDTRVQWNQFRAALGIMYPLRKKIQLRAGYQIDYELGTANPDKEHVLLLRLTFDLDKKEDEDKSDPQIGM
jgi:hypothetical protein